MPTRSPARRRKASVKQPALPVPGICFALLSPVLAPGVVITRSSGFPPAEVAVGGARQQSGSSAAPQPGWYRAQVLCPLHGGRERRMETSQHPQNISNYAVSRRFFVGLCVCFFLIAIRNRRVGVIPCSGGECWAVCEPKEAGSRGHSKAPELPRQMSDLATSGTNQAIPSLSCCCCCCWLL